MPLGDRFDIYTKPGRRGTTLDLDASKSVGRRDLDASKRPPTRGFEAAAWDLLPARLRLGASSWRRVGATPLDLDASKSVGAPPDRLPAVSGARANPSGGATENPATLLGEGGVGCRMG